MFCIKLVSRTTHICSSAQVNEAFGLLNDVGLSPDEDEFRSKRTSEHLDRLEEGMQEAFHLLNGNKRKRSQQQQQQEEDLAKRTRNVMALFDQGRLRYYIKGYRWAICCTLHASEAPFSLTNTHTLTRASDLTSLYTPLQLSRLQSVLSREFGRQQQPSSVTIIAILIFNTASFLICHFFFYTQP